MGPSANSSSPRRSVLRLKIPLALRLYTDPLITFHGCQFLRTTKDMNTRH